MNKNISLPESEISEWKSSWDSKYLKWLCAYANTNGGKLYIGVNDDGYVMGLRDYRDLQETIPNSIRNTLHITASVSLKWAENPGINIRYVDPPENVAEKVFNLYVCGKYLPKNDAMQKKLARWEKENPIYRDEDGRYYYIEISIAASPSLITYKGVAYVRSGSTLQILEGHELETAVLQSSGLKWDSFESKKQVSELDPEALRVFRNKSVDKRRLSPENASVSDDVLIRNLNLMTDDGKLTRAAAMLFSDPEKVVPGAYIKIGFFAPAGSRGMNSDTDVIYHDDIHGPLIMQADKVIDYLYSKYLKALISYNGLQRIESYMIPQDAMREIVLNAIAHKNYPSGNPIQIKVFDDHITIMNEGFWPFDKLSVEKAYTEEHSSYRNNPLIADGLYMAGDIETWGSGFTKIRKACERYGTPLPEITATEGSVTIRISPAHDYLKVLKSIDSTEVADNRSPREVAYFRMKDMLNKELKEREKRIILPIVEYFAEHDEISTEYASVLIGKSLTTAWRYLNRMKELGLLEQIGKSHSSKYVFVF